jgi:hypothetical protein
MKTSLHYKITISTLTVLFIFSSCQIEPKNGNKSILHKNYENKIIKLKSKKVTLTNIVNHSFTNFQIVDSFLLVSTPFQEPFFHIYYKNSLELITSFGMRGNGPLEFNQPELLKQVISTDTGSFVLIMDNNKINFINLEWAFQKQQKQAKIKKITLPALVFPVNNCILINNNYIFGVTQTFPNGNNFILNIQKDSLFWTPFTPILKQDIARDKFGFIYNNFISISPNGKMFFSAFELFKRINIFNNKDSIFEPTVVLFDSKKQYLKIDTKTGYEDKNSKKFFIDVYSTNNYLYALNFNMSNSEITSEKKINSQIFKLDWKGDLISIYEIDPFITSFIVDETNHNIIASSQFYEDYIFLYTIDKISIQ